MYKLFQSSLIISVLFLSACQNEESAVSDILRPVRTIVIEHPNSGKIMQYSAVVDASQKADLSFKVSGELVYVYVKQGDEVKKNQILAKLDDTDMKLSLAEAQSDFEKAKADYNRGTTLIEKNVISKADMDQLRAQHSSSNTRLESAKNNLKYTKLYASFDGVIAKKYTENFQEITAKQSILALHNIEEIHLKINVPESVIIQIPREDASRTTFAIFDDIPNRKFPTEFKEVSLQADEVTKTYEVTFSMTSPKDHTILPGMTAILRGNQRMTTEDKKKRFYLPSNSVLKDSKGNFVYVVEAVGDGKGKIRKLSVTIGEITSEGIEVFSGVSNGEYLVTAGVSKISDGMIVKFTPSF